MFKKIIAVLAMLSVAFCTMNTLAPMRAEASVGTPSDGSFLWQGETYTVAGGLSGEASKIEVKYMCRSSINSTSGTYRFVNMIYPTATTHFSSSITIPNYSMPYGFPYPQISRSGFQIGPYLMFFIYYADGTQSVSSVKSTIIYESRDLYEAVDKTFYYQYYGNNSFIDAATGIIKYMKIADGDEAITYNCLAYAINQEEKGWIWDFDEDYPANTANVVAYMNSVGFARNTTSYHSGAKVIAYGFPERDEITHFGKVVDWDSNGEPTAIESKWGGLEVIKSTDINPFTSVSGYGVPMLYFN